MLFCWMLCLWGFSLLGQEFVFLPPAAVGGQDELSVQRQDLSQSDTQVERPAYAPYRRKKKFPHGRILLTSMGEDMSYRLRLTELHAIPVSYDSYDKLYTGYQTLEALKGDSIRLWIHYSHGSTKRIYGHNPRENKYYIDIGLATSPFEIVGHPEARSLVDLKKEMDYYKSIKFSHDAIIYLGACWVAQKARDESVFAQELARTTGVPVIAGSERTEPLEETIEELTYSNRIFFYKFMPDGTSHILGEYFCLSDLIQTYKQRIQADKAAATKDHQNQNP